MTGPVGISGTREGCNSAQWTELRDRLEQMLYPSGGIFIHGDCVGVDEEAHRIARQLGYFIEIYPPENPKHRAWCDGDIVHAKHGYHVRNRLIVDRAATMLIVPAAAEADAPRSGTWSTYRYTLEVHKSPILIVGGRFDHKPVFIPTADEPAPVDDDALPLPPLKVESWRELPPTGESGLPPRNVHRQGPRE